MKNTFVAIVSFNLFKTNLMKKTILLSIGVILLCIPAANAQMVLEYDIVTANTEIALPLAGTVNVNVDWGDGSPKEAFTTAGNKTHTFR